jgi:hypothetical protein
MMQARFTEWKKQQGGSEPPEGWEYIRQRQEQSAAMARMCGASDQDEADPRPIPGAGPVAWLAGGVLALVIAVPLGLHLWVRFA